MKVVITPSFPVFSNEDMLQWNDMLVQLKEEGFDPSSDEYYSEVDKRLRNEFPHKFQTVKKSGGAQVAAAAASASRSTAKSGRRSVKLTHSQVAIAKKLGVPLETYAKYVKE